MSAATATMGRPGQARDYHGRWAAEVGENPGLPAHAQSRREYTFRAAQEEYDRLKGLAERMEGRGEAGPGPGIARKLMAGVDPSHYEADHEKAVREAVRNGVRIGGQVALDYPHLVDGPSRPHPQSARHDVRVERAAGEDGSAIVRAHVPLPGGGRYTSRWVPAVSRHGVAVTDERARDLAVDELGNKLADEAYRGPHHGAAAMERAHSRAVDVTHPFAVPAGRPLVVASQRLSGTRTEYSVRPSWVDVPHPHGSHLLPRRETHFAAHARNADDDGAHWRRVGQPFYGYGAYDEAVKSLADRVGPGDHLHDPVLRQEVRDREDALARKRAREDAAREGRRKAAAAARSAAEEYYRGVDEAASNTRGKKSRVTVQAGARPREVAATVYGNLAVHKAVAGGGWSVTHVPTGLHLGVSARTMREARGVVHLLHSSGVTLDFKDVKKPSQDFDKARHLVRAWRNRVVPG